MNSDERLCIFCGEITYNCGLPKHFKCHETALRGCYYGEKPTAPYIQDLDARELYLYNEMMESMENLALSVKTNHRLDYLPDQKVDSHSYPTIIRRDHHLTVKGLEAELRGVPVTSAKYIALRKILDECIAKDGRFITNYEKLSDPTDRGIRFFGDDVGRRIND